MKPLTLDSTMTTVAGVFYPTGHLFGLCPDEDCVRQAGEALQRAKHRGELAHATPEAMLENIVHTLGTADAPLPSVGAEADMVRRIADLAGQGHHGLLIAFETGDDVDQAVRVLEECGASAALYYRTFVIEDLIAPPTPVSAEPSSVVVGTHAPG